MNIAVGADHAGFELAEVVGSHAASLGHSITRFGAESGQSYDYPLASDAVVAALLEGRAEIGVLICGTGIGVSIRANRYFGIRAAVCCSPGTAELAREHNGANILCLGARTMDQAQALETFGAFVAARVDPAERHNRRRDLLDRKLERPAKCLEVQ